MPKVKIRAKAAPVKRVARKAAPVRTYRAAKATRTVARKATAVRTRISTVQRKTSPRPAVRAVRQATAPKARPAQRAKTSPTKINSSPSKIIKSSVRKATTAKRSSLAKATKVTRTPPAKVLTVPAVEVAGPPGHGLPVPAVVTPEVKVTVGDSIDLSAPPVGLRIPLLSIPTVTLPPVELPTVTIPGTELPRVILPPSELPTAGRPQSDGGAVGPIPTLDQRARTVDGAASGHASQVETAHRPLGLVAGGSTVMTAYTALRLSLDAGVMRAIGPPAVDILDQLGQRIRAMEVPASVGPATALIIAAAIAAATGTVSSGSAGGGGLAVVCGHSRSARPRRVSPAQRPAARIGVPYATAPGFLTRLICSVSPEPF